MFSDAGIVDEAAPLSTVYFACLSMITGVHKGLENTPLVDMTLPGRPAPVQVVDLNYNAAYNRLRAA